ncbi:MAG: hypothetical protein KGQ36_04230 [Rickettsiales bacterium]|nr:hypothetical protein [Rickettsiales bacterium]
MRNEQLEVAEHLQKEVIDLIGTPTEFYNHYALNFIIDAAITEDEQARLIPLDDDHNFAANIPIELWNFQQHDQTRAVIPIRPIGNQGIKAREHFAGLYIEKNEDGYSVAYIDPVGSGSVDDIPEHIRNALFEVLGISSDEIISTTNRIQHRTSSIFMEDEVEYLTNVHCGPFTGFILSGLALGNIRITEDRLEINTTEGWQDIPDLDEEQSNSFGKEIRARDLELVSGQEIDDLDKSDDEYYDDEYYKLERSDSNMSQYSDLVEEMISDQIDPKQKIKKIEYKIVDAVTQDKEVVSINQKMKELESENRSIGYRTRDSAKGNKITKDEGKKLKAENKKKLKKLIEEREELPEVVELDYVEEDLSSRRMHLFRGKSMNTMIKDPITGERRERTKKEKEEYVTKKYIGIPIYSDATYPIRSEKDELKEAENKVREYVGNIKKGTVGKEIFGNDTSYTNAVEYLMELTGLKGCPLVATSKFSCVAGEYNVGQMGGSSGGGRSIGFGYQKDGKPVNRVLGNGFAISVPISDYKALRDSNDLIDATMDAPGELTLVNRKIEEVTFTSKIDGKFVRGSLPMVLPRLDRNWDDMTREKHLQYRTVFNLEKKDYKKFQKLLEKEGEYPLGQLTEHLIKHNGRLLRNIAINADRREGYQGEFVAIRNSSTIKGRPKCGDLEDINNDERRMAERDARTDSSSKTSPYLKRENPIQTTAKLEDRLITSTNTPIAKKISISHDIVGDSIVLEHKDREPSIAKALFKSDDKSEKSHNAEPLDTMSMLERDLPSVAPPKSVGKTSGKKLISISKSNAQSKGSG